MASDLLSYALFGENVSENMFGSKAAKGDDRCGSPPMWKLDHAHHDYSSKQDPAYVSGDGVADNNNDTCCGGHAEALEGDLFPNDKMVMPLLSNEKWKNGESLKGGNLDIPGLGQMGFPRNPRVREMELKTTFASVTDWFDDLAVDSEELEDTTKIERWNRQGDRKYWLAGLWEIDRSYLDNVCPSEGEPGDILREDMLFAEWDIADAFWQRSKDEVQIQRNLECMDYEENANPTIPMDNANQENQKNLSSSWNAVNIMFDLNLPENYREQFKEHREEFETKQMSSLNRTSEGFGDLAHEVVAMEKGIFPLREEEIDIILKLAGDGQQLEHMVDMGTMLEGTNIIPKFINPYTGFLHFVKENSLAQEHEESMKADFVESSQCISGMAFTDHSENDVLDKDMEVGVSKNCSDQEASGGLPHEALFYTLAYVSLQDLLSVERVCKSLRVAVKNDVLLWRHLHVEYPLNKKLTNDALLQLSSRAQGHLQCLSLVNCLMITDDGLKLVLDSNPALTKLCLPGCTRITAQGIVQMVKGHTEQKRNGMPGLKHLRIRGLYGLTKDHLDNLKSSMHGGLQQRSESLKPQFYQNGHYSFSYDDDRSIDVEVCPKCENARLVYDCTRERCLQRKDHKLQQCRGCIFCIARCEECGRCIDDNEYEETFCLDLLCSSCWLQLPKCLECNRPGCGRHADHFMRRPDTTFVCGDCRGVSASNLGPEFHGFA